jgi:hypothetical protein
MIVRDGCQTPGPWFALYGFIILAHIGYGRLPMAGAWYGVAHIAERYPSTIITFSIDELAGQLAN